MIPSPNSATSRYQGRRKLPLPPRTLRFTVLALMLVGTDRRCLVSMRARRQTNRLARSASADLRWRRGRPLPRRHLFTPISARPTDHGDPRAAGEVLDRRRLRRMLETLPNGLKPRSGLGSPWKPMLQDELSRSTRIMPRSRAVTPAIRRCRRPGCALVSYEPTHDSSPRSTISTSGATAIAVEHRSALESLARALHRAADFVRDVKSVSMGMAFVNGARRCVVHSALNTAWSCHSR